MKQTVILNCKAFFVGFICSLLFIITRLDMLFKISAFSVILSIFFGISVATTQILQAKAMGSGPASMVTLIYSCGFLIPIFYGIFFWGETVTLFQWFGIALLAIVLYLILGRKGDKVALIKWLPFAIASMLGSGTLAILQKTHQFSSFADELPFFLVYSLFFSALFTFIASLIIREKNENSSKDISKKQAIKNIVVPICLGICASMLNFLNLTLSGKLPSVIHFPVYNIGSMLLTSIISAVIYKDKPSKRQAVGFCLGIIAILIVGVL